MRPKPDPIQIPARAVSPPNVNPEQQHTALASEVDRDKHPNALMPIPESGILFSVWESTSWSFPARKFALDASNIGSVPETALSNPYVKGASQYDNSLKTNPLAEGPLVFKHDNVASPISPSYDDSFNTLHLPIITSVQHYFDKLYKSLNNDEEKNRLKEAYRSAMQDLSNKLSARPSASSERLELLTISAKKTLYETYLGIYHDMESIERYEHRALDRQLFTEIFEESNDQNGAVKIEDPYSLPQEVPLIYNLNWWKVIKVNLRNFLFLRFLPFIFWLFAYQPRFLYWDILAGCITGVLCVAQGLGFGLLAGLPPVYGLYCALVPPLIYMLFGTSPHISIGPSAITSLLIGESVKMFERTDERIAYALLLSFLTGCALLLCSLLNLGFLIEFFSGSIMIGFQTAVAVLIIAGQIRNVLGMEAPRAPTLQVIISHLIHNIHTASWQSIVISAFCFLAVFFFLNVKCTIRGRKFSIVRFPYQILVLLLSILVVYIVYISISDESIDDQSVWNVRVVGPFQYGLPKPTIPRFSLISEHLSTIILDCFSVSFISVLMTINIGRRFASVNNYDIEVNQEIYALGLSHLAGSIFQAYPHAAGFGRSVSHGGVAKTQLSNLVISLIILFTLLVLLPIFFFLPVSALAVLVIMSVSKLIPWRDIWYTYKVRAIDFVVMVVAFLVTLFAGVVYGVIIAGAVTSLFLVFRASRPNVSIMGRVIGTSRFANARYYKETMFVPGILVIRFDSDLYFINASYLHEFIFKRVLELKNVWAVILDCESVSTIDVSGIQALQKINKRLHQNDVMLLIAHMKYSIQDIIKKADPQFTLIHETQYFPLVYAAEQEALRQRALKLREMQRRQKEIDDEPLESLAGDDPLIHELLDQPYTQCTLRRVPSELALSSSSSSTAASPATTSFISDDVTESPVYAPERSPLRAASPIQFVDNGEGVRAMTTHAEPVNLADMPFTNDLNEGVDPNFIVYSLPNEYQTLVHSPKDVVSATAGLGTRPPDAPVEHEEEPNKLRKL